MTKRDYIDFQDRTEPLAYLITFRCYGTWFRGDERGSVDRRFFNSFGDPKIKPNQDSVATKKRLLKSDPFRLGEVERSIVEKAISEVCSFRGITLHCVNVRSNHAHAVVANGGKPERLMNTLKAIATKRLREAGLVKDDAKLWSRHGSTKYLWTEDEISEAIYYVSSQQGDDLQ